MKLKCVPFEKLFLSLQNNTVSPSNSGPVYSEDFGNGSVSLTIPELNATLSGAYTCTARNIRAGEAATLQVFGPPPPPPAKPVVMTMGNDILISWMPPTSAGAAIAGYVIEVFK
jgi:hypothetical protein